MKQSSDILRLFVVNWAIGIALGMVFAAALLLADIGGIYSLISRSGVAIPAMALLFGGFSITCGGVVCASAIMQLPHAQMPSDPGLKAGLEPIPVRVLRR